MRGRENVFLFFLVFLDWGTEKEIFRAILTNINAFGAETKRKEKGI